MKHVVKMTMLTLSFLAVLVGTLTGCGHEHTFASEWSNDVENHWHAATCEHTDEKDGLGVHIWDDGTVTTPATEEATGVKTYTCTICGATKTETIDALSHTHQYFTEWSKDDIYHWYASTCGHDVVDSKAMHTWNAGVQTKAPTEDAQGETTYTCTVCGQIKTEPIAKLNHTCIFDQQNTDAKYLKTAATCTDRAVYYKSCKCGVKGTETFEYGTILDHTYGEIIVDKNPTGTAKGEGHKVCSVCGHNESVEVATWSPKGKSYSFLKYVIIAKDSTAEDWIQAKTEKGKSDMTNDQFAAWLVENYTNKLSELSTYAFAAEALTLTQTASDGKSTTSMNYIYTINGNLMQMTPVGAAGTCAVYIANGDTIMIEEYSYGVADNEQIKLYSLYVVEGGVAPEQEPMPSPTHEHTYGTWIAEIPATCENAGVKGHYHCTGCGKDFDAEKAELASLVITALGHDYDAITGKCKRTGCTSDIGVTLTGENNGHDHVFTPVGNKIYFNFKTIGSVSFEIDSETEQSIIAGIESFDQSIVRDVKLYQDSHFDSAVALADIDYVGDTYFYWDSYDKLLADTVYYCVVTLDKADYDKFTLYFEGCDKATPTVSITTNDRTKYYDGDSFVIEATSDFGTVSVQYVAESDYESVTPIPWSATAPILPGTYVVNVSVPETDTVYGRSLDSFIIHITDVQQLTVNKCYYTGGSEDPKGTIYRTKIALTAGKTYVVFSNSVFDVVLKGNDSWTLSKGSSCTGLYNELTVTKTGNYFFTATKNVESSYCFSLTICEMLEMSDAYYGDNSITLGPDEHRLYRFALNGDTAIKLQNVDCAKAMLIRVSDSTYYTFTEIGGKATSAVLPADGYYLTVGNYDNSPKTYDTTLICCHSTWNDKGNCDNCSEPMGKVLTADDSETDVTFTPHGDKIYFNFTTINADTFYFDTENQQKLASAIDASTPCLVKSLKLYYVDGGNLEEVEIERYTDVNNYYYYGWNSIDPLFEETKYYCVVTLDTDYVDTGENFVAYFSGVSKYGENVEFTTTVWTKTYDGTPLPIEAQPEDDGDFGTVMYLYKVYGADDDTYSSVAPVDAGHYEVKAYLDSTAYTGYAEFDFTITKKDISIGGKTFTASCSGTDNTKCSVVLTKTNVPAFVNADDEITLNFTNGMGLSVGTNYGSIYNGYDCWTITASGDDTANYNVLLDDENSFNLTIEKSALTVKAVIGVQYDSSNPQITSIEVTSRMCENLITGLDLGTTKIQITVPAQTYVGWYTPDALSKYSITATMIDSDNYTLSDDSEIMVIVYGFDCDLGTSIFSSNMSSQTFSMNVAKYFKIVNNTAGYYVVSGNNDLSVEVIGETPVTSNIYWLDAGTYYLRAVAPTTGNKYVNRLTAIAEAPAALYTNAGYVDDYNSTGETSYYKITIADDGLYQLSCNPCLSVSIAGVNPSKGGYYYLASGDYVLSIYVNSADSDLEVSLVQLAITNEPLNITSELLGEDSSYFDETVADGYAYYYYVDIAEAGLWEIGIDDGAGTISILGAASNVSGIYELFAGRYIIQLLNVTDSEGDIQIDFYTPSLTNITSDLIDNCIYTDSTVENGKTYYYYIDITEAGIYELYYDDDVDEAAFSVFGHKSIDNGTYYELSAGRYIVKLVVTTAVDGDIDLLENYYPFDSTLAIGTLSEDISLESGDFIFYKVDLDLGDYSLINGTTEDLEIYSIFKLYSTSSLTTLDTDDSSFTIATAGTYYIIVCNYGADDITDGAGVFGIQKDA